MAGDTTITVVGNLTADPELRFTPSGAAVANFTVASTPRSSSAGQRVEGRRALFLRCNIWREAAETSPRPSPRGSRVIVPGRLKQRSYETREGEKRTVVELEVDEIGPSLRYATAKVKGPRSGGGGGGFAERRRRRRPGGGRSSSPTTTRGAVSRSPDRLLAGTTNRRSDQIPSSSKKEKQAWPRRRKSPAPEKPVKAASACSARRRGRTIDYKDTALLRTYVSERGKIRARRATCNRVQHQRDVPSRRRTPARRPCCRSAPRPAERGLKERLQRNETDSYRRGRPPRLGR